MSGSSKTAMLDSLKPGDPILIIHGSITSGNIHPYTVDRLTPTTIIVGNRIFYKKNGQLKGDINTWSPTWISNAPEHFAQKEWLDLRARIIHLAEKIPQATGSIENARVAVDLLKGFSQSSSK